MAISTLGAGCDKGTAEGVLKKEAEDVVIGASAGDTTEGSDSVMKVVCAIAEAKKQEQGAFSAHDPLLVLRIRDPSHRTVPISACSLLERSAEITVL